MGQFVRHGPCPNCGSSDARAYYAAGDSTCFACGKWFPAEGQVVLDEPLEPFDANWTPLKGQYRPIMKRGITEETCRKSGYQIAELPNGRNVQVANIYDSERRLLAQKTRDKDKNFAWKGQSKNPPIYLSWTWPAKGKSVTLTEGELDALSFWQAWDHRWAVGSIMNGAGSAAKEVTNSYERLLDFDFIYLAFDNDKEGQRATEACCRILPVGRVKIITFPQGCKDANDVLMRHGPAALQRAFYDAKTWRPDGLREGREFTRFRMLEKLSKGYELPYPTLSEMWMGLRDGEVTTICGGSGIGKSTVARDIAYKLRMVDGKKVGNIFLEENNDITVKAYVGLHQGVPLKQLVADPRSLSDEQWDVSLAAVIWDGMMFYDHFGSLQSDRLMTMMRYMIASGCRVIVLDHISIVMSGNDSSDERKDIDKLMTQLSALVNETGISIINVVHLKRVQGKDFNKGAEISLSDLRGSAGLEQLSMNVLAIERNQQNQKKKVFAQLRSLKCRITGETGKADLLKWNVATGRYEVVSGSPFKAITDDNDDEDEEL